MIRRTHDMDEVRRILFHDAIWPSFSSDDTTRDFQDHPHILYLVGDGALFIAYPLGGRLWEAHSAILPWARSRSREFYLAGLRYLAEHTKCTHLIGLVADGNFPAKAAARAAGMKKEGYLPNCAMRGGRLVGKTIYGIDIPRGK